MKAPIYAIALIAVVGVSSCLFEVSYRVGGTVTGLRGTGLVLEDNSRDAFGVASSGAFTFPRGVAKGSTYSVTVKTQPSNPVQTCTVHNASGTIGKADVTNVLVSCTQAGRFAYVANQNSNDISAFSIDSSSGFLIPIGTIPTGSAPVAALVDPDGTHLYVVNNQSSDVSVFAIDNTANTTAGALTPFGIPILTGNAPSAIAIDPANRYSYVTNSADNTVSAYVLNDGAVSGIAGSPYPVGAQPIAVTTDPLGNFLYVVNFAGSVSVFAIDSGTGQLTAISGSPFGAGAGATSIAIDPTGTLAYVANATAATISVYSVNTSTGALTLSGSVSTGSNPESLVVNPAGDYLYAANVTGNDQITNYGIAPISGALTAGTAVATNGVLPLSVVVDPMGNFVYTANRGSGNVSVLSVGAAGTLTPVSGSPFPAGSGARSIAID